MPNEEKKVSNWEERFEKEFIDSAGNIYYVPTDIKSFIASVREEAYAEGFAKGVEETTIAAINDLLGKHLRKVKMSKNVPFSKL